MDSDRIPIITLFNKFDVLEKDLCGKNNNKENGSIFLSFPNYDGNNTYDDIVAYRYLNTMCKSFDVDRLLLLFFDGYMTNNEIVNQRLSFNIPIVSNTDTNRFGVEISVKLSM